MLHPGFNGYLSLKKEYNFTRNGVKFDKVLAVQLIQVVYQLVALDKLKLKETKRLLYKTLDVSPLADAFKSHNVISTYILERKDYTELLNSYFAGVTDYKRVFLPSLIYKTKFAPLNIINVFSFVFLKRHSGTLKEKLYIACYLVYYLNILNTLGTAFEHINLVGKKYIPFNSSFDIETLLVQFFKGKGVDTYHISHGLSYIKYNNYTGFDAVNGENITAEKILVWGESSKTDLINNYRRNAGTITVAGNAKYPYKTVNARTGFKKGIIFLGGAIYDKENEAIINLAGSIAAKHGIQFAIKAHPFSNIPVFEQAAEAKGITLLAQEKTIDEILQASEYDFAIAYNTTVYYEAMYYDMVCFRYAENENGAFNGLDDKFYDEKSFGHQLQRFKKMDLVALGSEIEKALVDNLGMGINKYSNIFNN
jgi:hypothetical protein